MADTTSAIPPALLQLLGQSVQRQQYQDPLFQAVTNQAFQGLPTYARQGLSLGTSLPPIDPAMLQAGSGGGGGSSALKAALAGLAGGLAGAKGGDITNLGKLIAEQIKKLFGKEHQFQNDKPGEQLPIGNQFDPTQIFEGWQDTNPSLPIGNPYDVTNPGTFTGWAPQTPNVTTSESFFLPDYTPPQQGTEGITDWLDTFANKGGY